jgi:CHAT domain-containing protein
VRFSSLLDNQTAVLSFLTAGDVVYVTVITRDVFELKRINVTSEFKSNYKRFIEEVYAHDEGKRYEGFKAGKAIYGLLIKPLEELIGQKRKWVIMPDGFLNYLPFDGLSVDDPKDFLVSNHVISYHYSMSLLMYHMQHQNTTDKESRIMFFAPFARPDQLLQTAALPLLPFSLNEAPAQNMMMFTGPQASKKQFLEQKDKADIIHLATHATAGSASGALISFYPSDRSGENNNLYLDEIYALDLNNTSLVILSACETGAGRNVTGEGILSLSRGFMYAGSKGMLSTLWKTEDEVSAKLMKNFYNEMQEGYTAEEALQRAKVKFLEDRSVSEKYKTPNYWSNFIYVGRINEAKPRKLTMYLMIPAALCFLMMAVIVVVRKRQAATHANT